MKRVGLLISSAGRRVSLLRCFRQSALELGIELRIVAVDLRPEWSAACMDADASFPVPACSSAGYADALLAICRRERIDLLVPTIDSELLSLSLRANEFASIGCRVAVSSPEVVAVCRDKLATSRKLAELEVRAPRSASAEDVLEAPKDWPWPLFAKPRDGSASAGIAIVKSIDDLSRISAGRPMIVQECLQGQEYTVNLFVANDGRLVAAVPHSRIETRAGEVSKGRTEQVQSLQHAARQIASGLPGCKGGMCFQAFVDSDGRESVFEINARFGGGYPLAHQAGATATRWLLEEVAGLVSSAHNNWRAGLRMLRYDEAKFVEG